MKLILALFASLSFYITQLALPSTRLQYLLKDILTAQKIMKSLLENFTFCAVFRRN